MTRDLDVRDSYTWSLALIWILTILLSKSSPGCTLRCSLLEAQAVDVSCLPHPPQRDGSSQTSLRSSSRDRASDYYQSSPIDLYSVSERVERPLTLSPTVCAAALGFRDTTPGRAPSNIVRLSFSRGTGSLFDVPTPGRAQRGQRTTTETSLGKIHLSTYTDHHLSDQRLVCLLQASVE
jgi:hypothetical protein